MLAVKNKYLETVKLLIERGACIDMKVGENGKTALQWALMITKNEYRLEMVKLLLEGGADATDIVTKVGSSFNKFY